MCYASISVAVKWCQQNPWLTGTVGSLGRKRAELLRGMVLDQSSFISKSIAPVINFKLMLTILICIF